MKINDNNKTSAITTIAPTMFKGKMINDVSTLNESWLGQRLASLHPTSHRMRIHALCSSSDHVSTASSTNVNSQPPILYALPSIEPGVLEQTNFKSSTRQEQNVFALLHHFRIFVFCHSLLYQSFSRLGFLCKPNISSTPDRRPRGQKKIKKRLRQVE